MNNRNLKYKHKHGFKAPEGYFGDFENEIRLKVKLGQEDNRNHKTGFSLPENYFEEFESNIKLVLDKDGESKVPKLFTPKNIAYISGIAASLILLISLVISNQNSIEFSDLQYDSIQSYIENEDLSAYELANLLEMDELNIIDYPGINFNDESIEEYLIEHVTVEELFNEQK